MTYIKTQIWQIAQDDWVILSINYKKFFLQTSKKKKLPDIVCIYMELNDLLGWTFKWNVALKKRINL